MFSCLPSDLWLGVTIWWIPSWLKVIFLYQPIMYVIRLTPFEWLWHIIHTYNRFTDFLHSFANFPRCLFNFLLHFNVPQWNIRISKCNMWDCNYNKMLIEYNNKYCINYYVYPPPSITYPPSKWVIWSFSKITPGDGWWLRMVPLLLKVSRIVAIVFLR